MAEVVNVLVFPAGEVNSVELHDALATNVNVKVFGGSSVERHGSYIFKNYIPNIPRITEDSFIEVFNEILQKHNISVVFATHDTVALFLAEHADKIAARLAAPDITTVSVCRDKQLTYDTFKDCSFVPQDFSEGVSIDAWPVFVKPREGQGSVGARLVSSLQELTGINPKTVVITEYLPGEEYTVDCLTDHTGKLLVISPRSRDRTMAGIAVASECKPVTDEIRQIAETINSRLRFRGLWYFQIKQASNGNFKLLEISVRCAGAMCLTRARGVNLPLLTVYTALGLDVTAQMNDYHVKMDRTLISRYKIDYDYKNVYLDFDDTVVVDGKVHLYAAMFLHQCKNTAIPVHLITRHEKDIQETLVAQGLHVSLFASIIHLKPGEPKPPHITAPHAIFIDNAYQERVQVQQAHGIPVLDVDGLEVLLDWRT